MSSKKEEKKKGSGKKQEKDLERERLAAEEARKQQQRQEALDRINVLERSGLLDAYEHLLRAVCKNGLPEANIFEFAAQQMLKYEKKMKIKEAKKSELDKSLERNNNSIEKPEREKPKPPSAKPDPPREPPKDPKAKK